MLRTATRRTELKRLCMYSYFYFLLPGFHIHFLYNLRECYVVKQHTTRLRCTITRNDNSHEFGPCCSREGICICDPVLCSNNPVVALGHVCKTQVALVRWALDLYTKLRPVGACDCRYNLSYAGEDRGCSCYLHSFRAIGWIVCVDEGSGSGEDYPGTAVGSFKIRI